jgi:hypothetical protein
MKTKVLVLGRLLLALGLMAAAAAAQQAALAPGAKIYVARSAGDASSYDADIRAALAEKHVPLTVVNERAAANFILHWHLHSYGGSSAATVGAVSSAGTYVVVEMSVYITDASGQQVYARSAKKRGVKSAAEDIAKHLGEQLRANGQGMTRPQESNTSAALPTAALTIQQVEADPAQRATLISNMAESKTSAAAAAALADADGVHYGPAELAEKIREGQASRVAVLTAPAGAEVYLDGNKLGITPIAFVLQSHDVPRIVTLRMNGYKTVERELLPDGKTIPVSVALEPEPPKK